ncbi:MAG TPA: glycosyltransferase [Clostridia bacterium]|nr:glycosyltransferase [Clostridia bacterium]
MSYAPMHSNPTLDPQETQSAKYSIIPKKTYRNTLRSRRKKTPSRGTSRKGLDASFPVIVHCHLCWDWVWQRPQQFISRLSQRHKVLFVETIAPDPELAAPMARYRKMEKHPNITRLTLQFPAWRWMDGEYVDSERRRLVQEFVTGPMAGHFDHPVQWFYDPMAVPAFAGHMGEILTVYDCMDELSKFKGAPEELVDRELQLLERADLVFTGGRKLFEAKSQFHDNCHFYGCGVDGEHFGKARLAQTAVPDDLARLPKPVLGFFGVIDERMDYDLVARLADANSDWSVAIVGPVTKVDPHSLPQRANLHWMGQRSYDELPAICKGFDVCMMPFALNEATEYINPTKALEYMATGREIVSTAVPDVVRNFGSVVKIAKDPEEFVLLCQRAIEEPDTAAIGRGLKMADENSWDSIVNQLENHMAETLKTKRTTD